MDESQVQDNLSSVEISQDSPVKYPSIKKKGLDNGGLTNKIATILVLVGGVGLLMLSYSYLAIDNGWAHSVADAKNIVYMSQWGLIIVLISIMGVLSIIMSKFGMLERK